MLHSNKQHFPYYWSQHQKYSLKKNQFGFLFIMINGFIENHDQLSEPALRV